MKIGEAAPDFTLKDGNGDDWTLSDHKGQTVCLLFYPGDNTPVCTKQLCSVRDNWDDYQNSGAVVVGISTDSAESHKSFSGEHGFPFKLLADGPGEVVSNYGVGSWVPGKSSRAVVVIDKMGKVAHHRIQSLGIFRPSDDDVLAAIEVAESSG